VIIGIFASGGIGAGIIFLIWRKRKWKNGHLDTGKH
jgi:hypothetical protein